MGALVYFPFVVVRIDCTRCTRSGSYRLARLAQKYGAETGLEEVLSRLTADCVFRKAKHPYRQGCGARFADLGGAPRPPDMPLSPLRVIAGGKRS